MGLQRHLDIELVCPMSGFVVDGLEIPLHKMATLQCENGSLFARCPNHVVKTFISDFTTVKQVMKSAVVLQVTDRKPGNKKERSIGKAQK